MPETVSNLPELLRLMQPILHEGVYVYASVPPGAPVYPLDPIVTVREHEGMTVVVAEAQAIAARLHVLARVSWITLNVRSDLNAVGFTAACSTALAQAGFSCNVVAGAYHDHIFVPVEQGRSVIATLETLQQKSTR